MKNGPLFHYSILADEFIDVPVFNHLKCTFKSDCKRATAIFRAALSDKVTDPFKLHINEAIMHVHDKVLLMLLPH